MPAAEATPLKKLPRLAQPAPPLPAPPPPRCRPGRPRVPAAVLRRLRQQLLLPPAGGRLQLGRRALPLRLSGCVQCRVGGGGAGCSCLQQRRRPWAAAPPAYAPLQGLAVPCRAWLCPAARRPRAARVAGTPSWGAAGAAAPPRPAAGQGQLASWPGAAAGGELYTPSNAEEDAAVTAHFAGASTLPPRSCTAPAPGPGPPPATRAELACALLALCLARPASPRPAPRLAPPPCECKPCCSSLCPSSSLRRCCPAATGWA
jgi:hypothetical protein